jgi:hypothetical protein
MALKGRGFSRAALDSLQGTALAVPPKANEREGFSP